MKLIPQSPKQSLNKAYLKQRPLRSQMDLFKSGLIGLLDKIDEKESEEFHKNLVSDFLKKTIYQEEYFINTKGHQDLVIHNGKDNKTQVGVILEAKRPNNKADWFTPEKPNGKAIHELVLYYLRERIEVNNIDLKYLIATNINEWYIIDASHFEKLFYKNKVFVKHYEEWRDGQKVTKDTGLFYNDIVKPFIDELQEEIPCTYFNFQDYEKALRNEDQADDKNLIALLKILSPNHLLKVPFANDSNSLDKRFYSELLHIIGLTEVKEGGKKLIERSKPGERHSGTLLESAIVQLDSLDKLSRLDRPSQFGSTRDEQYFNVGLELCITWINRILFLKLMEAQLIAYHKGDKSYTFLTIEKIKNYDDLNSLFFQVLARQFKDRNEDVKKAFEKVPYLNSSLFEPTDLEQITLFISNLKDNIEIPLHSHSVLKDKSGKKRTGGITALEYLFEFLNAYDFSGEGSEEVQEDNKTLINASVLGLIFEKINGYKDGSFFTPGFITMYMCRETIRKAVVQKFNETKKWSIEKFEDLYDKIEDRKEANDIVNSLKICDPAVGSGHFLVSALNEIVSVKNDLKILSDRNGKRLKEYHVEVVNDELVVTDEEGDLFEYNPSNKESQRIQETLFHEKETIIEKCLFGVDINPNSVKICRLRLWIELLKSAYYKNATELETLPNIDINIKCGNSLVSRFAIDSDLKQALKKSKWSIDSYKLAVDTYRNAESKEQKREMEKLIADIKSDFRSEISTNDPKVLKLRKLSGELFQMTNQQQLFEMSKKEKAAWNKKVQDLTTETKKLETEIEEIKANKIFENAFEWRFEFPEVLNDEGDFVGFDIVIGNPPYVRHEQFTEYKNFLLNTFTESGTGTADLFVYFIEQGVKILKNKGEFSYIVPNKWMRANYGLNLRRFIAKLHIIQLIDFGDLPVFEEATTYPNIIQFQKTIPADLFYACKIKQLNFPEGLKSYINKNKFQVNIGELIPEGWTLSDTNVQTLLVKIKSKGVPLSEFVKGKIFRGVLTGLNDAFVIDSSTKDQLIAEDSKSAEIIKPFLTGREVKRYQNPINEKYLIFTRRGISIDKYPAIYNYLLPYKESLEPKPKDWKGNWKGRKTGSYKWYEIQDAVDYYEEFEKVKIVYPNICKQPEFTVDNSSKYTNQKCFIITKYTSTFLGILNSSLYYFLFKSTLPTLRGDFFEPSFVYLKDFPVINQNNSEIDKLVEKCLNSKRLDPQNDISSFEHEIDQLVYKLFDLSKNEIKIIEDAIK